MITGGLGFVGSHLAESLVGQKNQIIIVTKSLSKLQNIAAIKNKVKIEQVDVTDFNKFGKILDKYKPDVIFHLAGETSHSKSFENPLHDIDSNAKSTLFILEKIRKSNKKCKFILGSTFIVVGRPDKLPVTEETPCNPTTIYGINRLASEHYCKVYHTVYGLDTRIFRITNGYGPREQYLTTKNAVNYLIYKAFKDKQITVFNKGKFFRDLIFISDVISALKIIMRKGKAGNLYWISCGKKTWFYEFGRLLEKLTDAKINYVSSPSYTKKVDVGNFVVDNSKLRALGWKPKINLREGIQKTLDYFSLIQ